MTFATLVHLLVLLAFQDPGAAPLLVAGEPLEAEIGATAPEVHTPRLDANYTSARTAGFECRLVVEASGTYRIDLRSYDFDAYLVVRDGAGELIGEDDDGLIFTHARLAVELEGGAEYRVTACALHGGGGSFRLDLAAGAPVALTPVEKAHLELEEARAALAHAESTLGPDHLETVLKLNGLAFLLYSAGDYGEAKEVYARALAIREAQLGPEHTLTGESLNNLAALHYSLGDYGAARPLYERAVAIQESQLGPDHVETGGALNNLAVLLRNMGEHEEALVLFERALAIREAQLGPDHPQTASTLANLGALVFSMADFERAQSLFERALSIREALHGPDHPDVARCLSRVGSVHIALGDPLRARPIFERALVIKEAQLGRDHPSTAVSLDDLAGALNVLGEFEEARALLERALAIRELRLGPDHPQTAATLNDLARVLTNLGDYARAEVTYERSLAIREAQLGPVHPRTAATLDGLAGLLREMGEYERARALAERALEIHETQLGADHPETAASLSFVGQLAESSGDYAEARRLFERALAILEASFGIDHPNTATSLGNLAGVLRVVGELERSRRLLERALAIDEAQFAADHPGVARSLNNLANLLRFMGEHDGAAELFERSLAIYESRLGAEHPETAICVNNLAAMSRAGGDSERSRRLYERALATAEAQLGPDHPRTGTSLYNLATLLVDLGEYEQARPLLRRALAIGEAQLGPDHPETLRSLNDSAICLLNLGEPAEAFELLQRASVGMRAHLYGYLAARTRADSATYLATLRWQQELLQSMPRSYSTPEVESAAASGLFAWKGQVGRAARAARRLTRDSEEAREVSERLRARQEELSRLAYDIELPSAARELRIEQVKRELAELDVAMRALVGGDRLDAMDALDLCALAPLKDANAALLSFFVHEVYEPAEFQDDQLVVPGRWSEPHLIAWVVRPEAEVVSVDLGLAAELEVHVRDYLSEVTGAVGTGGAVASRGEALGEAVAGRGTPLFETLWAPLVSHLGDASLVVVSHDRFTATLPLEVLMDGEGRYLVEERSFVYLHDLQSIAGFEEEVSRDYDALLCVGGVDFDDRGGAALVAGVTARGEADAPKERWQVWGALDATRSEVTAIHDLHTSVVTGGARQLVTGKEASEERVLEEMPRASLVHLATHGYFRPEGLPSIAGYLPEVLSGLVLAGANLDWESGRSDGYLTAADVDWLDLSGVELVTLSACVTGLGRSESGEGMSGFRTTLLRAGAETVVTSLWQVPDDSTERLMGRFYENLLVRGLGKLEALRDAQLWMLAENRRAHGEGRPHTWGAFVLCGDWR
jgi:CHAT domain-containing protein/tetratricopeptide (TPR) repeat protein